MHEQILINYSLIAYLSAPEAKHNIASKQAINQSNNKAIKQSSNKVRHTLNSHTSVLS